MRTKKPAPGAYHERWHPASGHRSGWRVVRGLCPATEHCGRSGRTIFFKTLASARRRAEQLNTKP